MICQAVAVSESWNFFLQWFSTVQAEIGPISENDGKDENCVNDYGTVFSAGGGS